MHFCLIENPGVQKSLFNTVLDAAGGPSYQICYGFMCLYVIHTFVILSVTVLSSLIPSVSQCKMHQGNEDIPRMC